MLLTNYLSVLTESLHTMNEVSTHECSQLLLLPPRQTVLDFIEDKVQTRQISCSLAAKYVLSEC